MNELLIDLPNRAAPDPLLQALADGNSVAALEILYSRPNLNNLCEQALKLIGTIIATHMHDICENKVVKSTLNQSRWEEAQRWLEQLTLWDNSEITNIILAYRKNTETLGTWQKLIAHCAPSAILSHAIQLGANIYNTYEISSEQYGAIDNTTDLHLALRTRNIPAARILLGISPDLNTADSIGNEAQHCLYHFKVPLDDHSILDELVDSPNELCTQNAHHENFLSLALQARDTKTLVYLSEKFAGQFPYESELLAKLGELCIKQQDPRLTNTIEALNKNASYNQIAQILASNQIDSPVVSRKDMLSKIETLTYEAPSDIVLANLGTLEKLSPQALIPYEDLLLALATRKIATQHEEEVKYKLLGNIANICIDPENLLCTNIIKSLGIFTWIQNYLGPEKIKIYRIKSGIVETCSPSLLEENGYQKQAAKQGEEALGVCLSRTLTNGELSTCTIDSKTSIASPSIRIEIYDTCICVRSESHGALVIRNSTSEKAHNIFPRVAYWSNSSESNIILNRDNEFTPVLSRKTLLSSPNIESIASLTQSLNSALEQHFSQRFDTKAQTSFELLGDTPIMLGGYNSSGYNSFINSLENLYQQSLSLKSSPPSLCFINPTIAPFRSISFGDASSSNNYIQLSRQLITALRALPLGEWNDVMLKNLGLRDFLQIGFTNQAWLVIKPNTNASFLH
jgi:hypothetical protein